MIDSLSECSPTSEVELIAFEEAASSNRLSGGWLLNSLIRSQKHSSSFDSQSMAALSCLSTSIDAIVLLGVSVSLSDISLIVFPTKMAVSEILFLLSSSTREA